jgi:hypothetical protein
MRKNPYHIIVFPIDAGPDDVNRYAEHIISIMGDKAKLGFRAISEKQKLETIFNQAKKTPVFIIIPHDVEEEVVEKLRKRFWPFIFIVLTGQEGPTDRNLAQFEMLQPPLKKGEEQQVLDQISEVCFNTSYDY